MPLVRSHLRTSALLGQIREGEAPAEPLRRCVYLIRRLGRSFAISEKRMRIFSHASAITTAVAMIGLTTDTMAMSPYDCL